MFDAVTERKIAVRGIVLTILLATTLFQVPSVGIFLAALAYALLEARPIWSASRYRSLSITEAATASGLLLRRGLVWTLLALTVVFDLLVTQTFLLAVVSVALIYIGGVFTQSTRHLRRPVE